MALKYRDRKYTEAALAIQNYSRRYKHTHVHTRYTHTHGTRTQYTHARTHKRSLCPCMGPESMETISKAY